MKKSSTLLLSMCLCFFLACAVAVMNVVHAEEPQTITITDDFTTTALADSHVFSTTGVSGGASSHTVVPGPWGGTVTIADESYVVYKVSAAEGKALDTLKVDVNAKIWNQNNGTCHSENAVIVYGSTDNGNYAEVAYFGTPNNNVTPDNAYHDLAQVDLTERAGGNDFYYVKIRLVQSKAAGESLDLNNIGVKLGKVTLTYTEKQAEQLKSVVVEDDYTVMEIGSSTNVVTKSNLSGGNNSTHGVVPAPAWGDPVNAGKGYAVYKIAVPDGATFAGLTMDASVKAWTNTGAFPDNNIKFYVSRDGQNWLDLATRNAVNDHGESYMDVSYDVTSIIADVSSWSEAYVKVELNHEETSVSLSLCGLKLFKVTLTAKYDGSNVVETEDYSSAQTVAQMVENKLEAYSVVVSQTEGNDYIYAQGDSGYIVFPVSAYEFKQFYSLSMRMDIRCTVYAGDPFDNAIVISASNDGKAFTQIKSLTTDSGWANRSTTADLTPVARGASVVYIKIQINWPEGDARSHDWVEFGAVSFTGGVVDRTVYNVTYGNVDGATNENAATYTVGEGMSLLPAVKEHYSFDGWYLGEEKVSEISAEQKGDILLTAKWVANLYDVTLNAMGGKFAGDAGTATIKASYGEAVSKGDLPADPVSETSFIGWYKDESLTTPWVFAEDYGEADLVAGDTTLYAKYGKKVVVTFRYEDGTTADVTVNYTEGEKVERVSDPAREGYVFGGWYNGETAYGFDESLTQDVTLTAKWYKVYSVTYLGTENAAHANPATFIVTDEVIVLTDAVRTGYDFKGWFNGEEKTESIDPASAADVVLTAKWEVRVYGFRVEQTDRATVLPATDSIDYEGGAFTVVPADGYRVETVTVNGTVVDLDPDGKFNVSHIDGDVVVSVVCAERYTFSGSIDVRFGETDDLRATVYDIYNVRINDGDGVRNGWLINADYGKIGYIAYGIDVGEGKTINAATLTGKARVFSYAGSVATFEILISTDGVSWTTLVSLDSTTNGEMVNDISSDILAAKGQRKLFVKYVFRGGNYEWVCAEGMSIAITLTTAPVIFKDGKTVIFSNGEQVKGEQIVLPGDPAKNGYRFAGWYFDADGTEKLPAGYVVNEAVTLFAKWTAENYTIEYVLDGGENGDNPESYTVTDQFVLNGAEKEGYKFEGWYTNGSFEGEKITAIEAGTFGNVVLYAKYTKGFTVSYVLNGGENNPDNPVYYFSDEETALLDPVKEGFVFGGWYLDEAKTELVSAIAVNTTGDVTLYAEWIEDVVESESDGKTESKASGGCGGSVGGIGMISVLLPGVAWFFLKKKEG